MQFWRLDLALPREREKPFSLSPSSPAWGRWRRLVGSGSQSVAVEEVTSLFECGVNIKVTINNPTLGCRVDPSEAEDPSGWL